MIAIGCLNAFLAVVTGAFGAHALQDRLSERALAIWNTATEYHMIHALALILLGLFEAQRNASVKSVRWGFLAGIVLFSGSLYVLALSGIGALGAITPLGGVAFLFAWLSFARAALKQSA